MLLASPGYDYVLSGFSWSNPAHITYSLAPDGVFWDRGTNSLNATFNAKLGTSNWKAQIARALATWQSVANINIVQVADSYLDFNSLGMAQSDSRFGDIRFGGYVFPNHNTSTLAQTYFPPPNGSTAAGDVEINTALNFNIGSTYDLFSVVLHETGHSLGLEHPPNPSVVMAANYGGVRTGLTSGDIAGIQAIYGARSLDTYQQRGLGFSLSAPIDVGAGLTTSAQTTISGLSLQSIGSSEYFTLQAPGNATGNLTITASAAGISMLSPKLSVYDDTGKLVGQASNPSSWSNQVTVSVAGVVPGRRYAIVVTGATGDVFDAGSYALSLSLPQRTGGITPSTPPPVVPPPAIGTGWTSTIPPDRYEPNSTLGSAAWLGRLTSTTVAGLTLSSGSDLDFFSFQAGKSSTYKLTASGVSIQVYNARGRLIAQGSGQVGLPTQRAGTTLYVRISPSTNAGVSSYSLSVSIPSPVQFWHRLSRPVVASRFAARAR